MLAFFDESGDAGMAKKPGQTPYFVVTLVLFEDNDDAEKADRRIDLFRGELGLPAGFEFRFHACKPHIRTYVLREILPYSWFYLGVVINKAKLWSPTLSILEKFYNYCASLVFENAKPHLREAIVVLDASGGKTFRAELCRYLKRKINGRGGLIKKLKTSNSATNNLVQLADMVAGSIYRSMTSYTASPGLAG